MSVRQAGYIGVPQPGAGLFEPAYAEAFEGLEVVVLYDAGEEHEAREDALKLLEAGAKAAHIVEWPKDAPHGTDVNDKLVEDQDGFEGWLAEMIAAAKPPASVTTDAIGREGEPNAYVASIPDAPSWPKLAEEALWGLPGEIVEAVEPHTEADPVAVLTSMLAAFGNTIGRGAFLRVGADVHHLKLNVGLVGDTSKGRKGMSWGYIRDLMGAAERRDPASRRTRGDPPRACTGLRGGHRGDEGLVGNPRA